MNNKHLMSKVTKTSSWITDGLSQKDIDEALEEAKKRIEEVRRKREEKENMTREEKIALLIDELEDIRCNNFDADTDEDKTLKEAVMVIKALEQKPILDKVKAEIEHIIDYTYDSTDYDKSLYNGAYKDGLYEALDIIYKYKTESEK